MKITKSIIQKALKEVLSTAVNESSKRPYTGLPSYRKSFVKFVNTLAKKGKQKNTEPYTDSPTVGKSGPAGSP